MVDFNALKAPEENDSGQWVTVEDGPLKGVQLRVLGLNTRAARRFITRERLRLATRARPEAGKDGEKDSEKADELDIIIDAQVVLLSDVILLDWRGITHNGEPFPFSREAVREAIDGDETSPLAEAIAWAAAKVDGALEATSEELEKNSQPRSGAPSTAARSRKGK